MKEDGLSMGCEPAVGTLMYGYNQLVIALQTLQAEVQI